MIIGYEQKKIEFLNDFYKMFPAFFSKENDSVKLWNSAYLYVFSQYKNREIDFAKLREIVFSSIENMNKPPAPNKIKEALTQCLKPVAEKETERRTDENAITFEELPLDLKEKIIGLKAKLGIRNAI